jgi:hypothetical protein
MLNTRNERGSSSLNSITEMNSISPETLIKLRET